MFARQNTFVLRVDVQKAAALKRGRIKEGRAVHADLLVDGKDRFDGRVRKLLAVQHGQRHGDGNAVVAAKRCALCVHIVAVDLQVERILCEIDRAVGRFFRHHVEMTLKDHSRGIFIARRTALPDDDIVHGVLHAAQTAFLCKADAVIADGLGVAGAVRDPAKILKEAEYGARLQLFQYAHRKNLLNM